MVQAAARTRGFLGRLLGQARPRRIRRSGGAPEGLPAPGGSKAVNKLKNQAKGRVSSGSRIALG